MINVKKPQLRPGYEKRNVKLEETGNKQIIFANAAHLWLCHFGNGYARLLNGGTRLSCDFRRNYSVQAQVAQELHQAATVVLLHLAGCLLVGQIFIETHPNPKEALSDGPNMIPLSEMSALWRQLRAIDEVVS